MKIRSGISVFFLAVAILTVQARTAFGVVDVGVSAVIQPSCSDVAGSVKKVRVVITNFGTIEMTSIPFSYKLNDGPPVTQTFSQSLAPSASDTFELVYLITVPAEPFTLCSFTTLPDDANSANDKSCVLCNGTPTSIQDHPIYSDNGVIVYPNPSSGIFTLKVEDQFLYNSSILISDILGKVVWASDCIKPEFYFDLSDQPNGLYVMRLKTTSGSFRLKLTLVK